MQWESGHTSNIFQAKTVGYGNNTIVSCARDGQVPPSPCPPRHHPEALSLIAPFAHAARLWLCVDVSRKYMTMDHWQPLPIAGSAVHVIAHT